MRDIAEECGRMRNIAGIMRNIAESCGIMQNMPPEFENAKSYIWISEKKYIRPNPNLKYHIFKIWQYPYIYIYVYIFIFIYLFIYITIFIYIFIIFCLFLRTTEHVRSFVRTTRTRTAQRARLRTLAAALWAIADFAQKTCSDCSNKRTCSGVRTKGYNK